MSDNDRYATIRSGYDLEKFDLSNATRLVPENNLQTIEESIEAPVKDPLWFLSRQWQLGEFKAKNGGHIVRAEISETSKAINDYVPGMELDSENMVSNFELDTPLEMIVEQETTGVDSNPTASSWDEKALCYNFFIKKDDTILIGSEYDGHGLDWYHFDLYNSGTIEGNENHVAIKPMRMRFPGAPHERWWTLEDWKINFINLNRPLLNYLTALITHFAFLYTNDWYIIPLEQSVGHLRKINQFKVMDSFGIVSDVSPVIDASAEKQGWEVFTLANRNGNSDGSLFYLPNNLYHVLESESIEKISFFRDESANLVWAVEEKYFDKDNNRIILRVDSHENVTDISTSPRYYWDVENECMVAETDIDLNHNLDFRFLGPLAVYREKTYIAPHWIPYVPRQQDPQGNLALRRGRTISNLVEIGGKQYKSQILSESRFIHEEVVPRTGFTLERLNQLARAYPEKSFQWTGRKKRINERLDPVMLKFDFLV
jgi:hypothetical protein